MEIAFIFTFSFYFIFRFIVAGDAMLNAAMESSSGSYQYDRHVNINKTMVNTSSFARLPAMLNSLSCTLLQVLSRPLIIRGVGSEKRKSVPNILFSSKGSVQYWNDAIFAAWCSHHYCLNFPHG